MIRQPLLRSLVALIILALPTLYCLLADRDYWPYFPLSYRTLATHLEGLANQWNGPVRLLCVLDPVDGRRGSTAAPPAARVT